MRTAALLALATILSACAKNDASSGGNDLAASTSSDMAGGVGDDLAWSGGDLALGPADGGYSPNPGGGGASCTTACDCSAGLGCINGTCVTTNQPVYCCGGSPCPSGSICQASNGQYGFCSGTMVMGDLASFDYCPYVDCSAGMVGVMQCMHFGCSTCLANGSGGMSCSR